jgi:acyl-CoA reductase-like NAD-dependent aldehyde dehydrogenase
LQDRFFRSPGYRKQHKEDNKMNREPGTVSERVEWNALIGGEWQAASDGERFTVEEPATGEIIAHVAACGADEIDAAVRRARRAYDEDWRWQTPRARGKMLLKAARLIQEHAEELAALETREVGKTLQQSLQFDVRFASDAFEYFAGLTDVVMGNFMPQGAINSITIPEPYGVVGGIIPFNWPPIHFAGKVAPALAAGNTVVLKPGEQAPLTAIRMVELLQEALPPGVLNIVPGLGPAGAALVAHPLVGKLSFTGSTATGRSILKEAANRFVGVLLELGGKNPFVVFADADMDIAVRDAIEGMYFNQGEACTAASLLLLHESIHDRFVSRFAQGVEKLRVGDGLDSATELGPMVNRSQQERVLQYIEVGKQEGAKIVAQGKVPSDSRLANGFFVPPTVFDRVDISMRIAQEEIFGPVCVILTFSDYQQAMRLANGTEYGLTAAVYTSDTDTANRAARDIEAGMVFINNYNRGFLGTPFGGMKSSGYGREHAIETLHEFVRTKNVRQPSGFGQIMRWPPADRVLE